MKKTLIAMTMLAGAVSVYSQGTVSFNDYNSTFEIQVFGPQALGSSTINMAYAGMPTFFEVQGNSANSYNPNHGSATYNANNPISSSTYDVELFAVAGTSATTLSQLAPITSSLTSLWYSTPLGAGSWKSAAAVSIPGATSTATFAVAAWQNTGGAGAATTLAAAQADGYLWGVSDLATGTVATGDDSLGTLPAGLTDFSMAVAVTPEPSTIALGVLGASALLFRRRK